LTIVVSSSPNVRQEVQNIERHDSTVQRITFNGEDIDLRPDYPDCNPPGSNPAVCTSVWDPPTGGSLSIELLGPATFNIFGEFSGHAAQNYTLTVQFQPGDGQPATTHVNCTSLTYYYAPVICNSTRIVDVTGSGSGEFTVQGPARISALFGDFLSAPFQDWSVAYYFADQPVVDSVIPSTGPPGGGTQVTIRGSHFGDEARVLFGAEEATHVVVGDSNTITCDTPMGDPGPVDVSVVLFTNLRGSLKDGFVYGDLTRTPTPTATSEATETTTPTPTPRATETATPTATFDLDRDGNSEVDGNDVIVIIILIQDGQVSANVLFDLSRLWQSRIGG